MFNTVLRADVEPIRSALFAYYNTTCVVVISRQRQTTITTTEPEFLKEGYLRSKGTLTTLRYPHPNSTYTTSEERIRAINFDSPLRGE